MIKSFKDLEVYKESYELAIIVNKNFCDELIERYIFLGGKIFNLRENWKSY